MCGQINSMTERDRDVMRQMLRKKETHHLRLTRRKMNIDQFTTVKQLGKVLYFFRFCRFGILFQGAFGTVSLVRKKDTGAYYALKMLNKKEVSCYLEFNPQIVFQGRSKKANCSRES